MSKMRKVVTKDGSGRIAVSEEPVPSVGAGEVLIQVKVSSISPGTGLGQVKKQRANPDAEKGPMVFGYSNAGVVTELGEGCKRFKVGDAVAAMGGTYAVHGTWAVAPENLCTLKPEGVSFEAASYCHLAATALHALQRGRLRMLENIAICGLGPVGHFAGQWARSAGAHVVGIDRLAGRLELAKKTGAVDLAIQPDDEDAAMAAVQEFTRGRGLDMAVVAFGGDGTQAFKLLTRMMKLTPDGHRMGRIVGVGGVTATLALAASLGNIDVLSSARTGPGYHDDAWERGADYPPVFVEFDTARNLEESLRAMAEGRLRVEEMITRRMRIDDAVEACEELIQNPNDAVGVVLLME